MRRDASSDPDKEPGTRGGAPYGRRQTPEPWPTADGYRLSLLASIQTAEDVDLRDFFRKAYPEALCEDDEDG